MTARVDHYGPSERFVGGMASVLFVLRTQSLGATDVRTHSTWTPEGGWSVLSAWVGALGSILVLPRGTVVHVHVSEGGSFVRKGAVLWLARVRRLPRVATIHGYSFDKFVARFPWLVRAALRPAQAVTVLTEEAKGTIESLLPATPVTALENPVVRETEVSPAGEQPPTVFFGGEVGTRKGVDVLLRAWPSVKERVPEAVLNVAGPLGDLPEPVGQGIAYLGLLEGMQVREQMTQARVVVLPSRAEARPMVLLEAAACGRPFIATPVGSVADLARGGGVLVRVDDAEALAHEVIALLTNPVRATHLGEAAYVAAGERDAPRVGAALARVYAEIAQ